LICNPFADGLYIEGVVNPCPGVETISNGEDFPFYDPVLDLGCCRCQESGLGHGDPCEESQPDGACVQIAAGTTKPACSSLSEVSLELTGIGCPVRDDPHYTWWFPYMGTCLGWGHLPFYNSWDADGTCRASGYTVAAVLAQDIFHELGENAEWWDLDLYDLFKEPTLSANYYWYVLTYADHFDDRVGVTGSENRIYRSEPLPVVDGCVLGRGTFTVQQIAHGIVSTGTIDFFAHYGTKQICTLPTTLTLHAL
jgi:hypothetical protein